MAKQYGDEQVLVWRRSYDTCRPPWKRRTRAGERHDRRYAPDASQGRFR